MEENRKNIDEIMMLYNPSKQGIYCKNHAERCYFGSAPTLAELRQLDPTADQQWLIPQLFNLSEFSGARSKMTTAQLYDLASIISAEYYYMKLTEMMVFFFRFKGGHYGRFYGAVDPMTVTSALMRFSEERREIYARHEEDERRKRKEADDEFRKLHALTYDEWRNGNKGKDNN